MKRKSTTPSKTGLRKNKSKSKSKGKDKIFDPLEYLNSLIEGINDRPHISIKKKGVPLAKRDLASAMAHNTPISQRTAASSKVRCRSSYSQHRKRSVTLKDTLKIDLNAVTDDDYIQFTQNTIKETQQPVKHIEVKIVGMSRVAAARKIQRAWRNYQTLKVVRKYYQYYQGIFKKQQQLRQILSNEKYTEQPTIKKDYEHTLKIKRDNPHRLSPNTTIKLPKPVFRSLDYSDDLAQNQTKEMKRSGYELEEGQIATIQLPVLKSHQLKQYGSKDLNFIMNLFRNSQETVHRDVEEQLHAFCKAQAQLALSSELSNSKIEERSSQLLKEQSKDDSSEFQSLSPRIFIEMESAVLQKYQMYKLRVEQQAEGGFSSTKQRRSALEQLQGRMLREKRAIERCKQQYLRSIQQLKENMLKMQNDNAMIAQMGGSYARVRKSYSAESFIMKSILEEVSLKNMDLQFKEGKGQFSWLLETDMQRKEKHQEKVPLVIPTSPPSVIMNNIPNSAQSLNCYELDSETKLRDIIEDTQRDEFFSDNPQVRVFDNEGGVLQNCESISSLNVSIHDNSFREGQNSRMVRECSQQIQQQIESHLMWQIAQLIYLNTSMWCHFKPLVENPFQFKPITDYDIITFLEKDLPQHYANDLNLLQRINQKINPTTRQILRLIRDMDFQIEEYQLVLPQDVFKNYRKQLEIQYSEKIAKEQDRQILIQGNLSDELKDLLLERGVEKRVKNAKFMSFQRDLRIMYMKAIFNCFNQLVIQTKSQRTFMNGRSSIGPGQLTLALKQYNQTCGWSQVQQITLQARSKIYELIQAKCCIPQFKNHRDLQLFQKQMNGVITCDLNQSEYKWVNYMDEVLELWQEVSGWCAEQLIVEGVAQLALLF